MHGRIKSVNFEDPFYQTCCIADDECSGHIEIHHHFKYKGSQQDVPFGILPLCVYHHSIEKRKDVKDRLDWVMLNRTTEADRVLYNRFNWYQLRAYLTKKHSR